jgi:hypothetical protein
VDWADPSYELRDAVERRLARLEDGLACAVVTRERRVRVFVTSSAAGAEAARLLEQNWRGHVEIVQTSARFSAAAMHQILAEVVADQPPGLEHHIAVSLESPLGRDSCPRVEIVVPPDAAPALEQWATATRTAHGDDRVVIRRARIELYST